MIYMEFTGGPRAGRAANLPRWVKRRDKPPRVISCAKEAKPLGLHGVYQLAETVAVPGGTKATYIWKDTEKCVSTSSSKFS